MGRRTYEQALTFGPYPYRGTDGYVFSRTRSGADDNVTWVSDDPGPFIARLKEQQGRDIWLVGGSQLIHECMRHDLVDEYIVSVYPAVLGEGIPLFHGPFAFTNLAFRSCQTFDSGLVQLTYLRQRT
jgi:dihydrofolate reductase